MYLWSIMAQEYWWYWRVLNVKALLLVTRGATNVWIPRTCFLICRSSTGKLKETTPITVTSLWLNTWRKTKDSPLASLKSTQIGRRWANNFWSSELELEFANRGWAANFTMIDARVLNSCDRKLLRKQLTWSWNYTWAVEYSHQQGARDS